MIYLLFFSHSNYQVDLKHKQKPTYSQETPASKTSEIHCREVVGLKTIPVGQDKWKNESNLQIMEILHLICRGEGVCLCGKPKQQTLSLCLESTIHCFI